MAELDATAATAANRDVSKEPAGAFQDCYDVVHIAVFFDGTGNNRDADSPSKRWSNVARLFDASINDTDRAVYRIYVSGVGTAFNGTADSWLSSAGIWAEDTLGGGGFGAGGDRRMDFGNLTVNQRLRDVLIANAARLGGEVAAYAQKSAEKSFSEVNRALGKHRLIKKINISVFGFSRGAALARAFTNRLLDDCERSAEGLAYGGYPIRFNFLGLFDTVASFGLPAQNVRTPFSERELRVSPTVQRCVHYVAGHEVRFAFPVDLIRLDGKLGGDWIEKTYPGVHSDVGGGYEPSAQAIDNNYARIPMCDMWQEALQAAVRMKTYAWIDENEPDVFDRFECLPNTKQAYQRYMTVFGGASGSIEAQVRRHMELLYSAYGTMYRRGIETPGERSREANKLKYIGPKGMAWEIEKYRTAVRLGEWRRIGGNVANAYAQYVKPEDWQLSAWDSNAAPGVLDFVSAYVHDSKVDFLMNAEPFSYFKARGIEESTSSVWQDAGAWIQTKGTEAAHAVQSTAAAGRAKVEQAADTVATTAKETAQTVADHAREAAEAVEQRAIQARDYVQHKAEEAATAVKRTAEQAATEVRRGANQVADGAREAYDTASNQAQRAAQATGRKLREARDGAERIMDAGVGWVRETVGGWFGSDQPNK